MAKYKYTKTAFNLNAAGIDEASEHITEELRKIGVDKKDILRVRLSCEEALLNWLPKSGMSKRFKVEISKSFGRFTVKLSYKGEPLDPNISSDDEADDYASENFGKTLLANMGLSPVWQYHNGKNIVTYSKKIKKSVNYIIKVLAAVMLAIAIGLISKLMPEDFVSTVSEGVIDPVFNSFINLLSCVVGPMMLFSMIWGIYNIGDTEKLGTIGKKLFGRFILVSATMGIISIAAAYLCFDLKFGSGSGGDGMLKSIVEMITNIIPGDIVTPFAEGNTLQILFLGTIIGVAMIILKERVANLGSIVDQANRLVQLILSGVGVIIPVFIFLSVLRLMVQDDIAQNIGGILIVVALSAVVSLLQIVLQSFYMMRLGVSPMGAFKKMAPHLLISLSTASSAAALPTMIDTCKNKLGIDSKLTDFALPLGNIVCSPSTVNTFIFIPLYAAAAYGVEITLGGIILCFINAIVLSIATPSVPGGGLSCYTLLFMQLGIPMNGLVIALAADIMLDFTATACDTYGLPLEICQVAKKLDMVDTKILTEEL